MGSGGLIAINHLGDYSMEFNSKGMFRGVCESSGQCSIGIWEEMTPFLIDDAPESTPERTDETKTSILEEKIKI